MRRPTPLTALLALALTLLGSAIGTSGQSSPAPRRPSTRNGEWPHYTGDVRGTGTRRSIRSTPRNFNELEVAWRFKTDSLGTRPEYKLEGTPLMVKRRALHDRRHAALGGRARRRDRRAAVGAPLSRRHARRRTRRGSSRAAALAYWTDGRGDERILYVTPGYRLIALNAKTGAAGPVVRQGRRRRHEGRRRVRQRPADRSRDRRDRPPLDADRRQGRGPRRLVDEGGHDDHDPQQHQGPRARLRRAHRQGAVDVQHDSPARRVRQRHVARQLVGDQRQHRRVDADHGRRGARPGLPAGRVADVGLLRRQAARATTCSARASCASISKTGKRKWHFQFVHHPIWDHDMSSAPLLADVTIDGRPRKLVARAEQAGVALRVRSRHRRADLADRRERRCRRATCPGEWYAPTQPIPHAAAGVRPAPG